MMNVRRARSALTRIFLRTVAVAIVLAVWEHRPAPVFEAHDGAALSCDSPVEAVDAAALAKRTLPSVAAASLLKRLPLFFAGALQRRAATSKPVWKAPRNAVLVSSSERARVYRHVPRMECGEPPRA